MVGHGGHPGENRCRSGERLRVTENAADALEQGLAVQLRGCRRGWRGRSGHPHERSEVDRIRGIRGNLAGRSANHYHIRGILWGLIEHAARNSGALIHEQFVRDTLLNVVGFAREDEQRFVLRLPSEAGHGTIVAGGVQRALDTKSGTLRRSRTQVGLQGSIWRILYQPQPEGRGWNAENYIPVGEL